MKGYAIVGQRMPRTDSVAKVTGVAKYTADISLPGMLYGKILRSPYAHARIVSIDTARAERLPGVRAVVTGRDIAPVKFGVFKKTRDQYLLAIDRVRYMGEEVAGVAAIDEDIAEEALSLIKVEYEELPIVLDPLAAMEDGAPQLHAHVEHNIGAQGVINFGDVDEAFRQSNRIYEDRFVTSKMNHAQMEPYAALAAYDSSGKLDIWVPNQSPFTRRKGLSNALKMPLNRIRVHHVHIGGAFGGRSDALPAEFIAALLSIKTSRPVRIVYSREEDMIATRHKHAAIVELKMGVKLDGTIMGKDIRVILDGGAYMSSGLIATFDLSTKAEAVYRVPNIRYEGSRIYTNKTPCSMQRIHGNQLVLAEEMTLDRIAEELGLDPVEMRLRHACQAGDVLPSGSKITSFALSETIDKAVAASEWRRKKGKLPSGRGIGLACCTGFAGFNMGFRLNSAALVKFNEDGSCTLFTGNVDNGQGNESMLVQIASEAMGIPVKDIALVCADSELTPQDPGNYPMLAAFCSGNAVRLAGLDAKEQIVKIAAETMGVSASELEVKDSRVFVKRETQKAMRVADIVKLAFQSGNTILGRGAYTPKAQSEYGWADWSSGRVQGQQGATYTAGTTVAEVEVDRETGVVKVLNVTQAYDCGYALNPMAVEGQYEGVAVQMMGETLYEKLNWDDKDGRLTTDSFLDYRIPTCLDIPKIRPIIVESIDPDGPFGAKEAGLTGGGGVEAAIVNAIYDAVGVRIKDMPVTPEKILVALDEKER